MENPAECEIDRPIENRVMFITALRDRRCRPNVPPGFYFGNRGLMFGFAAAQTANTPETVLLRSREYR